MGEEECPVGAPGQGHDFTEVRTGAKLIRFVSQCSFCGRVDPAALDRWAEQAAKEQLSTRAQRIAMAAETEPFAFVESSREALTLEEVCFQALGAASVCWDPRPDNLAFDATRAKSVGEALLREVQRFIRLGQRTE